MSDKRAVWKYWLDEATQPLVFSLEMPREAEVLSFQIQGLRHCIWALVDPYAERELRWFEIVGTGWIIDAVKLGEYVATVQDGSYVWHLFERREL